MSNRTIFFSFANFYCQISGPSRQIDYLKKCYLKSPFAQHILDQLPRQEKITAVLTISVKGGLGSNNSEYFSLRSEPKVLHFYLDCSQNLFFLFPIVEQVLRKIFHLIFFKYDGFVLHASCVTVGGKAHIFWGKSGSGKSTIALRLQNSADKIYLLADNNVYIKKIRDNYFVFPPAFLEWNLLATTLKKANRPYQIKNFFILNQSRKTHLWPINLPRAYSLIYHQIQIPIFSLSRTESANARVNLLNFLATLYKGKGGVQILGFNLQTDLLKTITDNKF